MFQLHQDKVIGKAAIFDPGGGDFPVQRQKRHQQQTLGIQHGFGGQRQVAVPPEMPVVAVPEHHEPMVQRPVKHMLAHVAPMRGRFGNIEVRQFQRMFHVGHRQVHQPGIAVRSAPFIGHPIGAHVPLFEHMHGNSCGPRSDDGLRMNGPGVAIQQDIGDLVLCNQRRDGGRPVFRRIPIGDISRASEPERPVARIEPHPPDITARRPQHPAQPIEKWPMRSLQEQKAFGGRGRHVVIQLSFGAN